MRRESIFVCGFIMGVIFTILMQAARTVVP